MTETETPAPEAPEPDPAPEPAPAPDEPEALVPVHVVARLLHVSEDWVKESARAGDLPGVKIGERQWRFRVSEVLAWADQRRVTAAS